MTSRAGHLAVAVAIAALVLTGCSESAAGQSHAKGSTVTGSHTADTSSEVSSSTEPAPPATEPTALPDATVTTGSTPTSTSISSTSTTASLTPTDTDRTTPIGPSTLTTTTDADSLPECVYGDWVASNEWFTATFEQAAGPGVVVAYVSGDVLVTFSPDGNATTHYRQWTNRFESGGATVTIVRDGVDTATFEVSDNGDFTMTDVDLSSVLTMTAKTPQGTVTMPSHQPELDTQTGTVMCMDKLLHVQAGDAEMMMGRPELAEGS